MSELRVGFAGTPEFAASALAAILAAGFPVPVVLTQPDRPRGRGLALAPSPVKAAALGHGIPCLQPQSLKTEDARASVLAIPVDVLVVAAYGLILPPAVLAWPRYGCLNIHASRLPRWRGAAPIQRAIAAGDDATGVTIMQMDAGLDTGAMIDVVDVPIAPRETAGTLHDKLAEAGAAAIVSVLRRLASQRALTATPQPLAGVTYAHKIGRADAAIDWTRTAAELDCLVRAMNPVPGAFTRFGAQDVKVWEAVPVGPADSGRGAGVVAMGSMPALKPGTTPGTTPGSMPGSTQGSTPGSVLAVGADGIDVACGRGSLRLQVVQPAAGKRMSASAFAAGRALSVGARFDAPSP